MTNVLGIIGAIVIFIGALGLFLTGLECFKQGLIEEGAERIAVAVFMVVSIGLVIYTIYEGGSDDGNWF